MDKRYKLYVEHEDAWEAACSKNYYIDEPVTVQTVTNGIILPARVSPERAIHSLWYNTKFIGGVCDADGNFIAGHIFDCHDTDRGGNLGGIYPKPDEIQHSEETVVYGGLLFSIYGHVVPENLSRMWWFTENPDCEYKFVFLLHPNNKCDYLEFFQILGIRAENIIILKEATRFAQVIVPDHSLYLQNGYKEKATLVYNAIRDNVNPAGYEKIYITRSKLPQKQIINEEVFENFYRGLGYEIVAMEQLPIRKQVAILAGAKDIVTTSGASHLQLLFCHDGVNITVLNRTNSAYEHLLECWVHKMRNASCTFIDVAVNPLPTFWYQGVQLFMPTVYWKRYINDKGYNFVTDCVMPKDDILKEYIMRWAQTTANADTLWQLNYLRDCTFADLLIGLNKLFRHQLDKPTVNKLNTLFPASERSFTAEMESLYKRLVMLRSLSLMVKSAKGNR